MNSAQGIKDSEFAPSAPATKTKLEKTPEILVQERSRITAAFGMRLHKHRIDAHRERLSPNAQLHLKKHETEIREMIRRGEDWRTDINSHDFYPPSVKKELIEFGKHLERSTIMAWLSTQTFVFGSVKSREGRNLTPEEHLESMRVGRHVVAMVQEYSERQGIPVEAAWKKLISDEKFVDMLGSLGKADYPQREKEIRQKYGLTTREDDKKKFYDRADEHVVRNARKAGISEDVIKGFMKEINKPYSPPTALMPELLAQPPAQAAQFARDAAMAIAFEVADTLNRVAEKVEEELRKPKPKLPPPAEKEKAEETVKKATKAGDEMSKVLKDQEDAYNKAAQQVPAAGKQTEGQETKSQKPLAEASAPRMRKPPAPDREVLPPDEFGGGAKVKATKMPKNPMIKTETPEKTSEAQARTSLMRIKALEKTHSGNGIKEGRFEDEMRAAIRSGDTKSLKDYIDQISRAIMSATAAKPPAGPKQAKA